MSWRLLAFSCSASFRMEQSSSDRVHTNKTDRAPYTVSAEFLAERAPVLRVPLIQTDNTNNPDEHSRNTPVELSDALTWEQAYIQPCSAPALLLWFVLLPIALHRIFRSPFLLLVLPLTANLFLTTAVLSTSLICISFAKPTQHAFVLSPPCRFNLHC